ncbi:D-galactosyl-beta-1-_4-L-rhamnose phosphorylase [bioreactor metagenome]|uniref:D-galactosyl-beta-1->4-L-rhamnose phosphorylase n=1 Tax=bioreactor metagenome TaxID=1076179 RepID=A0A645HXR8_9ZZZZ
MNDFGDGRGIYLTSFRVDEKSTRLLMHLLLYAAGLALDQPYLTDSPDTECAFYPAANTLAAVNMSGERQTARIPTPKGPVMMELEPYGFASMKL